MLDVPRHQLDSNKSKLLFIFIYTSDLFTYSENREPETKGQPEIEKVQEYTDMTG